MIAIGGGRQEETGRLRHLSGNDLVYRSAGACAWRAGVGPLHEDQPPPRMVPWSLVRLPGRWQRNPGFADLTVIEDSWPVSTYRTSPTSAMQKFKAICPSQRVKVRLPCCSVIFRKEVLPWKFERFLGGEVPPAFEAQTRKFGTAGHPEKLPCPLSTRKLFFRRRDARMLDRRHGYGLASRPVTRETFQGSQPKAESPSYTERVSRFAACP
jgi:hypothetical protein